MGFCIEVSCNKLTLVERFVDLLVTTILVFLSRFRVVNEGFVDESKEPSLLQGARELMEERQLDHQEMFLNTEKCKVESNALRKKATKLREILFSCPSVEARTTNRAAIIMEVIDNTVAARRMRAARDITHSVVAELQKQVISCRIIIALCNFE